LLYFLMGCIGCQLSARGSNGGKTCLWWVCYLSSCLRPQKWRILVNIFPFVLFVWWLYISICPAACFDGFDWVGCQCDARGTKMGDTQCLWWVCCLFSHLRLQKWHISVNSSPFSSSFEVFYLNMFCRVF
jgi:hypothetical protein